VYLTQSRGTIICTALVFVVWVLASGPVARRRGLMCLPPLLVLLFVPGIGDRLVELVADVSGSAANYSVDPSVLGRTAAQEMAWSMFRERPMFGFGPGVFESSIPSYAGMVPTAVLHPVDAAHNIYAQLAAESGIVGLEGWAVFVGGFIGLVTIRLTRPSADRPESDRSLAAAVLAAVIGWSGASLFLHLSYFRALASQAGPKNVGVQRPSSGPMRKVTVGAMLGVAGAATALAASMNETYVASRTVTLLPTEQVAGFYAYALDVRSRDVVLPTYAAMMAANTPGASADPDAVRGVITIRVAAADSYSAQAGLEIAMANAHTNLANFGANSYYAIAPVGPVEMDSRGSRSPAAIPLAVLIAAACAATTVLMMQRISGRRWRRRPTGGPHEPMRLVG
jgi:hypothetical protein